MVRLAKFAFLGLGLAAAGYAAWPMLEVPGSRTGQLDAQPEASALVLSPAATSPAIPTLVQPPKLVRGPDVGRDRQPNVVTVRSDAKPLLRSSQTFAGERGGDRYDRARLIQRELVRVGCYGGDPDGDWGPATKRAMQSFLERVNASLPIEEPDGVLLVLVQGQKGAICADQCRASEAIGTNGRCIPTALVAQRAPIRPATTMPQPAVAVAAPIQTAVPAPTQPPLRNTWRTDVAQAEAYAPPTLPGGLPPLAGPSPAGRMALGVGAPSTAGDLGPAAPALGTAAPLHQPRAAAPQPAAKPKPKAQPAWARNVFPQIYFDR